MSHHLTSESWHHLAPGCPIAIDVQPVDQYVEVVIGDRVGSVNAVTLILAHPDTCERLISAATEARDQLIELFTDDTTTTSTTPTEQEPPTLNPVS
ncbi:hypothetical protein ACTG9Q_28200 [Actinokineospora sp. 24-640]